MTLLICPAGHTGLPGRLVLFLGRAELVCIRSELVFLCSELTRRPSAAKAEGQSLSSQEDRRFRFAGAGSQTV